MPRPTLYILRHGETEWNAQGRLQGHFDSPLTERGRAQARAQRDALARCDLTGFVALTSPQGRAFHTASIALDGLIAEIQTDERLREIGVGDFAGRKRSDLMRATPRAFDSFDLYECAPGGEGFAALHARCLAFLDSLAGPSVIITHGITSRMLRVILLGHDIGAVRRIEGGQGVVYKLARGLQTRLTDRA